MKAPGQKMTMEQAVEAAALFRGFGIPKPRFIGVRKKRVARTIRNAYTRS